LRLALTKWTALALLAVLAVAITQDPTFCKRYLLTLTHGSDALPPSFYEPREVVPGANQPPAPRETPAAESLDPQALEAAASYAAQRQSAALIVTRHGYIVYEKYWQGTSLDTLIDSRSLGRILAALAVGIAISERKIGWPDQPIGQFITEWRDDPRGAITVRNLLQLSSGLAPVGSASAPWSQAAREELGNDAVTQYLKRPLKGIPGRTWLDQNVDPDLLALVIERATKERYAQYVSNVLWKRIGAGDAWLWLDRPGGAPHVGCCFFARQGDWVRVAELLLKNGNYQGDEVIVPRWVPQILQPSKGNAGYASYVRLGHHPPSGAEDYATNDVLVLDGGSNRLWLIPSLQIAILRTGAVPLAADWDDARIPNLVIRGARDFLPPAARPGSDLSSIVPHH